MQIRMLLLIAILAGQVREAPGTGQPIYSRVTGTILAGDTGRPVARAVVTIVRINETTAMQTTTTDEAGRYVLDSVLPGTYKLLASKPGTYVETAFGQSASESPGRLVTITPGQDQQIVITLLRGAVIAGRIFDQSGEPMPLAEVTLSPTNAGPHEVLSGFREVTNDRGEYRLFGLRAGEYLLSATAPRLRGDQRQYSPVYYPGSTDIASATRIQLTTGQELTNADFMLRLIHTVRVSGVAVGPDGQAVPGGSLAVYLAGSDGRILPRGLLTTALARFEGLSGVGSIKRDGTFSIDALPGHYILRGRYDPKGSPEESPRYNRALMVAQPLSVGDSDVSNLVLKFSYGATVKGRFVFEGGPPARQGMFRIAVETGEPGAAVSTTPGQDGSFTLGGIESGSRRIRAVGPVDFVLKGIFINGFDVADRLVEFGEETVTSDVSVVFSSFRTPLTVAIAGMKPGGYVTVFAFPEDESLWYEGSRRIVARVAGSDSVLIDSLPPGDYAVAAVSDVSPDVLKSFDAHLLAQLRSVGFRVQLGDRTPSAVRVQVGQITK